MTALLHRQDLGTQCKPGSPYRVFSEAIIGSSKRDTQTASRAGKQACTEGSGVNGSLEGPPLPAPHTGHQRILTMDEASVVPRKVFKVRVAEGEKDGAKLQLEVHKLLEKPQTSQLRWGLPGPPPASGELAHRVWEGTGLGVSRG